VDNTLWAAVLLLITCAMLRNEPRWWLLAGLVVGVSLYNKLLIVLLLISFLIGLVVMGPRSVLRSRGLWVGVGIAVVVGSPNLIYQLTHHFPQLTMAGAISGNDQRIQLIPFQFLEFGLPLLGIIIAGFRGLLRRPEWRPLRAIPIAYLASVVITLIGGGQIYYPFGLLAYIFVAGTVPTIEWINQAKTSARRARIIWLVALNGVLSILIGLPLLPVTVVGHSPVIALNPTVGDEVGWPTYVRTVASVYDGLPAGAKAHSVILTGNYGEAGSIVQYGPAYGLPSVYSGQNELYYHGPPPAADTTVIAWNEDPEFVESVLADCRVAATMDNGVGVDNEEQGSTVLVCQLPAAGWAATWPKLQHYD
jgi:4-amino-4-deoxy-L-arabinose transferase-like glycosyltransferase